LVGSTISEGIGPPVFGPLFYKENFGILMIFGGWQPHPLILNLEIPVMG
jgi:hypothetical protein